MINTLGAPSGGRNCSIVGNVVAGSFASNVVSPTGVTAGTGKNWRCECGLSDMHPPG
jgi:hypothetical protein